MYRKITAIVLNVMKYSDKNSIAHVYSDECGRMALLVPQGSTRGARMRNAAFMPLSIVEMEVRVVPGRDIYNFRDSRTVMPLATIYGDPVRSAVAMFVSELLTRAIQESERNSQLWEYLFRSVQLLDSMTDGVANFHICFLYNLGAFIGIQPDTGSYHEGYWFDMENGIFTRSMPLGSHALPPDEAAALMLLSRMNFANLHRFRFSHTQRNAILDAALRYFRLHNSTVGTMRSPEILRQIFA